MKIVNLTPHPITIDGPEGSFTIAPSGKIAKVATKEEVIDSELTPVGPIQTVIREFGEVEGVPAREDDEIYIVSSMVISAIEANNDPHGMWEYVYAPDTGPTARRDEKGQVVAVRRLVTVRLRRY